MKALSALAGALIGAAAIAFGADTTSACAVGAIAACGVALMLADRAEHLRNQGERR